MKFRKRNIHLNNIQFEYYSVFLRQKNFLLSHAYDRN